MSNINSYLIPVCSIACPLVVANGKARHTICGSYTQTSPKNKPTTNKHKTAHTYTRTQHFPSPRFWAQQPCCCSFTLQIVIAMQFEFLRRMLPFATGGGGGKLVHSVRVSGTVFATRQYEQQQPFCNALMW